MKHLTHLSITLLACILFSLSSSASVIYVDISANGSNDGSSWNNAYEDLQDALAAASNGDEIWVANGVYKPTTTTNRDISFTIPDGVSLFGGFSGNETSLELRDWSENPTTLSGAIGSQSDVTDNTKILIKLNNASSSVVIDGFRIQRAYNETGFSNIEIVDNFDVEILNCEIRINSASSGYTLYCNGTFLKVTSCLFRDNDGGGALVGSFNSSNLNISNTTISQNTGTQSFSASGDSDTYLANSISYGNTMTFAPSNWDLAEDCILEDGTAGILSTNNVINSDPLFVDPSSNDFTLLEGSPALDAGNDDNIHSVFDLKKILRKFGDAVDLGCYERRVSTTFYVDVNSNGLDMGGTWEHAFTDLQDAIFYAEDGDKVWVANGVYKPTTGNDRDINFIFQNEIEIYGGFAGNESSLDDRNWDDNNSIISGAIGGSTNTDNTKVLINISSVENITIDGFKIQRAYDDINVSSIIISGSNNVIFRNCEFRNNVAEIGIFYANSSTAKIENCLFRDNEATQATVRGVIDSYIDIYFSTLSQNSGGRVLYTTNELNIYNSIVFGNTANLDPIISHAQRCILEDGTNGTTSFFIISDEDPLFANPANNNFQLQEFSPAIGYGSNLDVFADFDLKHNDRIQNLLVDIGCYESPYQRLGCTDLEACNYDNAAEIDDGSCFFPGCTDPLACNYADWAGCDDGFCAYDACTDPAACNYNSGDLICENNTLCTYSGCTDNMANNYDPSAGCDDGSCTYGGEIIYLDWSQVGGDENGQSWAEAFTDLHDALDGAESGDEIWVAGGTYKTTSGTDRTISFNLVDGIKIFGGFSGNETSRDERNWNINETIISGEIGLETATDNAYNIFMAQDLPNPVEINGVIINDSYATLSNAGPKGAFYMDNSSLNLYNCQIRDCNSYSGVAILVFSALPVDLNIENCLFESCYSQQGQIISNISPGYTSVINSTFANIAAGGNTPNALFHSNNASATFGIQNCIFYNIGSDDFITTTSNSLVQFCLSDIPFTNVDTEMNVLIGDPGFVSTISDFRLTPGSIALDSGFNGFSTQDLDLQHDIRIQNGTVDIGCFEGAVTLFTCFGDANFDGVVDIIDLLTVSSNFGCSTGCTFGDADGNGVVDIFDLISVSSNFGLTCDQN